RAVHKPDDRWSRRGDHRCRAGGVPDAARSAARRRRTRAALLLPRRCQRRRLLHAHTRATARERPRVLGRPSPRPARTTGASHDSRAPAPIEAMARVHLEQVIGACPDGPLMLGGYCNGGLVAYETARLLTAAGRRVERLVLIATDADTRFSRLRWPIAVASR